MHAIVYHLVRYNGVTGASVTIPDSSRSL